MKATTRPLGSAQNELTTENLQQLCALTESSSSSIHPPTLSDLNAQIISTLHALKPLGPTAQEILQNSSFYLDGDTLKCRGTGRIGDYKFCEEELERLEATYFPLHRAKYGYRSPSPTQVVDFHADAQADQDRLDAYILQYKRKDINGWVEQTNALSQGQESHAIDVTRKRKRERNDTPDVSVCPAPKRQKGAKDGSLRPRDQPPYLTRSTKARLPHKTPLRRSQRIAARRIRGL